MRLLVFVLDRPCHLDAVLDAWAAAGVEGVTILESTGIYRRRGAPKAGERAPLFLGIGRLFQSGDYDQLTLFSVIRDESILPRVREATESVVGDLRAPNTGILFSLSLQDIWGVPKAPLGQMDDASRPCSVEE